MEGRNGEFASYLAWTSQNNQWVKTHDAGWWAYEKNNSKHRSPAFATEQQLDAWITANPL
jgi:hypothetical protein